MNSQLGSLGRFMRRGGRAIWIMAAVGIVLLVAAWLLDNSSFWTSFLIEVGVAVFLFGVLFLIERQLEEQFRTMTLQVSENVDSLKGDLGELKERVERQEEIERLRESLGKDFQEELQAVDSSRARPIDMAKSDLSFENVKKLLMSARDNHWIHGSGVRVEISRHHDLYLRFAPPGEKQEFINVRIEESGQHKLNAWRWQKSRNTAQFLTDVITNLEELHGGTFPREDFDPALLMDSLIRTIEVGYQSTTRQPGITPGITDIVQLPNEDFVITIRRLCCLYNDFTAGPEDLGDGETPLHYSDFEWRSEDNLRYAWSEARSLFAPKKK